MRKRFSRRNLGAGEQWGREVESEIETLHNAVTTLSNSADNNLKQTNGAINNLASIITTLQETTAQLAEQQEQILDTISKLSSAAVYWRASTNVKVAAAPAYTDFAVITNLTVPEGYSKALIMAVSQIDLTAYSPDAFDAFIGGVATVIGGQAGWMMPVHGYPQYEINASSQVTAEYQATTSASSSTVRYMENLDAGQQILVNTRADADGNIYATATTSCQAIFFK